MKLHQKGWSLTEVMLALVVISGMAYAVAPLFRKNAEESNAKIMADDFSLFQTSASSHFQSNRDAYIAAMTDGTGAADICKIGVDPATGTGGISTFDPTLHTCAVDGSILRFQQALPTSVRQKNRYGESWVAIFKLVYTTHAPIEPTGGVEMLVLSADLSGTGGVVVKDANRYSEAVTAGEFAGGQGGAIPDGDRATCVVNKSTSTFQACGNGWKVNLADFITPAAMSSFAARVN
ncbi:type II secretion system GspH family protein [Acidovorax delafieldii]|uniref:type II secretion system protein n=1 Tax=Acidovorax delafieldii TaxID=47920 RepID=UPI003ED0E64D